MRGIVLSCLLAGLLGGTALADDVTIATAQGEVTLPAAPARVVVMDVAALDTLAALGIQPVGRPNQVYVDYLPQVEASAAQAGTLHEPDLEAMANLGPDLIIVGGRSALQLDSVSRVAPAIDMTIGPDLLGDARARITAYGTLFGKEAEARALAAALDEKIAGLQELADKYQTALIILTNGAKLAAYGKGSRFGWVFEVTGLREAVEGLATVNHGNVVTHEFIAQANPDWLIIVDRGTAVGERGPSAEATLDNPLVKGTSAGKAGRIIYLDPSETYIAAGGYTALADSLDRLAEILSN